MRRMSILWWLTPIMAGAITGAVASAINHFIFYSWGIFYEDALREKTLFFIFSFTGLVLSYFLIHLLALFRTPKSSFHTILEAIHLTPHGVNMREALVKTTSAISTTVFGGASGPEGAAAVLGGGLSVWLSRVLKARIDARKALLMGVAAGISASFKTPLTGALFALELPYRRDLEIEPFIEASLASSSSYLVAVALNSPPLLSGLQIHVASVPLLVLPVAMGFGLITAGLVYLFTEAYHRGEALSKALLLRAGYPLMLVVGGVVLGVVGFICPFAIGPGFQMIPLLGGTALSTLLLVMLFRPISTIFTNNFGGSGGLLLPTLLIGGTWGTILGSVLAPDLLPVFVLMGMAAFSAGVNKVMLAPIVFIAEAFGTDAMIPVILSTVICYVLSASAIFYPTQPLNKLGKEELALERFYLKVAKTSPRELDRLTAADVMTSKPISLRFEMSVREAFEGFSKTSFRLMPVVDNTGKLVGYVTLEELASVSKTALDRPLHTAGIHAPLAFKEDYPVKRIIEEMINREADHAFVVDDRDVLRGIISGIDLVRLLLIYYTH